MKQVITAFIRSRLAMVFVLLFIAVPTTAQFSEARFITPEIGGPIGPIDIFAADLDGDHDLDILTTHDTADEIAWHENLGGSFGPRQVIAVTHGGFPFCILAADFDGDSDQDLLYANTGVGPPSIAWMENLGGATFGPRRALPGDGPGEPLTGNLAYESVAVDLDQDGDLDVLTALGNHIVWNENLGRRMGINGGMFSYRQIIASSLITGRFVVAVDLDNDQDLDVLFSDQNGNTIAWVENLGMSTWGSVQVIDDAIASPISVSTSDLDGDGDADVLGASMTDGEVNWYENTGGAFGPAQVLSSGASAVRNVLAEDLDEDGDPDILYTSFFKELVWLENDGAGNFAPLQTIHSAFGPWTIFPADLDGDFDADLLLTIFFDDQIVWFENLGTLGGQVHSISLVDGGLQRLGLNQPPEREGWSYWMLGSMSGTSPGIPMPAPLPNLPLNFDGYFNLTLTQPLAPGLGNFIGALDSSGDARAILQIPAGSDPGLAGLELHHAYLLAENFGIIDDISNPVRLVLTP